MLFFCSEPGHGPDLDTIIHEMEPGILRGMVDSRSEAGKMEDKPGISCARK